MQFPFVLHFVNSAKQILNYFIYTTLVLQKHFLKKIDIINRIIACQTLADFEYIYNIGSNLLDGLLKNSYTQWQSRNESIGPVFTTRNAWIISWLAVYEYGTGF